jgi:hypothetical protein
MICPNCHKEIPDSAKVCGYCGQRLQPAAPASQPPLPARGVIPIPAAKARPKPVRPAAGSAGWWRPTLAVILAAAGWWLAEWISIQVHNNFYDAIGTIVFLTFTELLFGLAIGPVFLLARPTIGWKGAAIIFAGWGVCGLLYGYFIWVNGIYVEQPVWVLVRGLTALVAGAATAWVVVERRKPFPWGPVLITVIGWGLVRGLAGLLIQMMGQWSLLEGLSGAMGVLITLISIKPSK